MSQGEINLFMQSWDRYNKKPVRTAVESASEFAERILYWQQSREGALQRAHELFHKKGNPDMQPTKKNVLIPYNNYTKGGKALAAALGLHFLKRDYLKADLRESLTSENLVIINWGSFDIPANLPVKKIVNHPDNVRTCADKLKFFDTVSGSVRIPEYTKDGSKALEWQNSGIEVMGRSRRGSGGEGIYFFEEDLANWSSSDFWVQYKKKKDEYRVHVCGDEVIAVQKKALRTTDHTGASIDTSTVDYRIRNLENGFVFKRHGISPPEDVIKQAKAAISAVKLDFGAVDVIYNSFEGKGYVLEVNTAPGLEGTTVEDYKNALNKMIA